ncbi:hypothetical protein [Nesterenkonia populi]
MFPKVKLSHMPVRIAAGALILNAGWDIRQLPEEAAEGVQEMGAKAMPEVNRLKTKDFREVLSDSELALGAALLLPAIPSWLAGAGLTAFSGGLLRMYLKSPEMTKDDGVRPTEVGTPIAKDIVMLGAGVTLILDDLFRRKQ